MWTVSDIAGLVVVVTVCLISLFFAWHFIRALFK